MAIAQGADPDPALLVDPADLTASGATETFLTENVGVITEVIVASGIEAIADTVVDQVAALLTR